MATVLAISFRGKLACRKPVTTEKSVHSAPPCQGNKTRFIFKVKP